MNIKEYLKDRQELVNSYLLSYTETPIRPGALHDSMKYSLMAGGKRIRPILCIASHAACGGRESDILPQACAIELIHTYSLIHDDLPAMDDDDLRRGKPTNHMVFGEAMAILAGDALLTDAFRLFVRRGSFESGRLLLALEELASSAGIFGMVAGQAQDILSENADPDEDTIRFIHEHKTAALIKASVKIGALLSPADDETIRAMEEYGQNIGLAFQVVDDILDIVSTTEELGKPSGSDEARNKMTYPAVYGLEGSRRIAGELIDRAIEAVKNMEGDPAILTGIAEYLLTRTN